MNNKYDFVIVGAGFAGASCARILTDKGYKCLIIEERPFVSGNCLTDKKDDIDIHFFGAHIIHTNNETVWNFLNLYGDIREIKHRAFFWNSGKLYNCPFGLDALQGVYDKNWAHELYSEFSEDIIKNKDISNIENYCLANYGKSFYEKIIKTHFVKKFNKSCNEINNEHLENLKIKPQLININSYYQDKYQGIPEDGYVKLVENIIGDDIDILLNTNFLNDKEKYISLGKYVIYTGEVDRFFNYCMGNMNWIGAKFEFIDESEKISSLTGMPIINFSDETIDWYRMTEHKWLTPWRIGSSEAFDNHTFLTYEFYREWKPGEEAYYAFYDERSINLYKRYVEKLKNQYPSVILLGRKAQYRNMSICEVIECVFNLTKDIPDKNS